MEENVEKISAKDVSMKWGLILAVISIAYFVIGVIGGIASESWFNWLGALPTIIIIVIAHNQFKNEGDGFMSYGEGLKIGMLVVLISSLIYTVFFYVYIKFIDATYIENIREQSIVDMQERGMSDDQIDQAMGMTEMFTSPELMAVFAIIGGLFFGFILSLIISAFTKNSNPELDV